MSRVSAQQSWLRLPVWIYWCLTPEWSESGTKLIGCHPKCTLDHHTQAHLNAFETTFLPNLEFLVRGEDRRGLTERALEEGVGGGGTRIVPR